MASTFHRPTVVADRHRVDIIQMKIRRSLIGIVLGGLITITPHVGYAEPRVVEGSRVTNYALALVGIPYRYGGTVPESGFDCSGFVGHVIDVIMGVSLPRSSHDMARVGRSIQKAALQPGDLVFHNTRGRSFSHVGIYLGNGQFIHSPKTGEHVQRADLNSLYWRARFNGARRIETDQKLASAEEDDFTTAPRGTGATIVTPHWLQNRSRRMTVALHDAHVPAESSIAPSRFATSADLFPNTVNTNHSAQQRITATKNQL